MDWNKIFEYRDGEIYWKIKPLGKVQVGDRAGTVTQGYRKCKYKQMQLRVHRIIWEMHRGKIRKGLFIDHIDGNGLNNKIENLRLVTPVGNCKNLAKQRRNKSGYTGVRWDKNRGKWFVHITLKNKMYNLGRYKSKKEAVLVRKRAEKKHGFHVNHGRASSIHSRLFVQS